jgi:hypothetical protein
VRDGAVGRIRHPVASHHDDHVAVADHSLDLVRKGRVPDAAGLEQRQRPPLVVHEIERRIDQEVVGPQPVERRDVRVQEGDAILIFTRPDLLFPHFAHRYLLVKVMARQCASRADCNAVAASMPRTPVRGGAGEGQPPAVLDRRQ